ncbi:acyltransferase family protein [Serratia marcescens]|uniref:acyltransferase family protein n=1 Tax=Serratia marcescens TaxID=615 RepID=UPI0027555098|nr:acyltransferase [Serratia marcescens]MDP8640091.1 acyltransferase [Serratia marcescens]
MKLSDLLNRESNNLDLIRLLCAYFVIYSHSFALSPSAGDVDMLLKLTGIGYIAFSGVAVKTFFLISGILVANSLLTTGSITKFVASRFLRVFPAFFSVVVLLALVVGPILTTLDTPTYLREFTTWHYISKTLSLDIQYILPGVFDKNTTQAVNGSLWTIPFEVKAYFYLLVLYILSIPLGKYKAYFIGIVSIAIFLEPLTPFKGVLIAKSDDPSIYELYPFFAFGCLLALAKDRIKIGIYLPIIFGAFYLIHSSETYKIMFFYLSASTLLLYASSLKIVQKIKLKHDISYGVYLWAFPVQQTLATTYPGQPYVNMSLSIVITTLIAYASFIFIEAPSMNFRHKLNVWIAKNN